MDPDQNKTSLPQPEPAPDTSTRVVSGGLEKGEARILPVGHPDLKRIEGMGAEIRALGLD
jgi:hypothetical protein